MLCEGTSACSEYDAVRSKLFQVLPKILRPTGYRICGICVQARIEVKTTTKVQTRPHTLYPNSLFSAYIFQYYVESDIHGNPMGIILESSS